MGRAKGTPTLDLSPEDNDALLALCLDNNNAEKKWLGGAFLRYGMEHPDLALAFQGTEATKRTRKRRSEAVAAPEPPPTEARNDGS
jgi:hypothetical protein